MADQRGFTVFELMCSLALFGVLCATMLGIELRLHSGAAVTRGYLDDLAGCRRALGELERDLRPAERVTAIAGGVRIHRQASVIDYTLADGILARRHDGRSRPVARRIAAFEVAPSGRCVELRIELARRSRRVVTRSAEVHTTVFLRGGRR